LKAAAVERALADEGVHQFEAAGAEFLLVLVAALQEVDPVQPSLIARSMLCSISCLPGPCLW
jgi:hypothetical protein